MESSPDLTRQLRDAHRVGGGLDAETKARLRDRIAQSIASGEGVAERYREHERLVQHPPPRDPVLPDPVGGELEVRPA